MRFFLFLLLVTMKNYKLEPDSPQDLFRRSRAPIQIFGGAYANGKTSAACIKALQLCLDYPGSNGLIARSTYPKLNDTIRKAFLEEWCPPSWVKRRPTNDDNTAVMANGTTVNFRYVAQKGKSREDGQTSSNLLSATFDWIVVDQIEDPEIGHKDFLDLLGRLRGSTPYRPNGPEDDTMPSEGPQWLILTANPSYGWFYKKIVLPYKIYMEKGIRTEDLLVDSETGLPIVDLIEADVYSNKNNLSTRFIKNMETAYKGQARDRYLLGKWAAYEGLVHPSFDRNVHFISRQQALHYIDDCRRRHVRLQVKEAYDFGIAAPSCYLLAIVDDWGRVVIIDGFHKKEFDYQEQPGAIHDIRMKYATHLKYDWVEADPGLFRRIAVAGQRVGIDTISKFFIDSGIRVRPADNSILQGIPKVNSYLNGRADFPHIITGEKPSPLLYVVDDLTWFEDEISSYYWKKNPQGQNIDEPQDGNDDAMNATKYLLTKLPEPSEIVIPAAALPPKWKFWYEEAS